ncbi:MAG: DNA gyrase inhibitor YacG [Acidobacteriaceae bacterium]|nr:DNA gyrase inhibitor YacG [Acidobacteriaceae bacterium]
MKCPICKRPVGLDSEWMPFCSERCKLIDLGNWASEKYVVPAPLNDKEDEHEE